MCSARRRLAALAAASLATLLAVPLAVHTSRGTATAGQRPPVSFAAGSESASGPAPVPGQAASGQDRTALQRSTFVPGPAAVSPEERRVPQRLAVEPSERIGSSSARLGDRPAPPAVIPPVALAAEVIGVSAPVREVGVEPGTRAMEVPEPADRVGWYRYGPAPGDPEGVAVMTAHVDSARSGPGAFFLLRDLDPGATVEVTLADGRIVVYEVIGREQLAKGDLPAAELFRREGAPALALVTCGGSFDAGTGQYADNVIVWAVPA